MKPWEQELGSFYETVDNLNAAGEGDTWLVYDKIGKRVCVLKKRAGAARGIYEKLRDAKNPHIPEIYRLVEHEEELLVIEEYIEGRTVAEILRYEERLPEKNVIQLLGELCSCLKLLHRENIIHRDIKPANIIIAREGAVKLIDFGIARQQTEAEEKDTEPLGTRGYAPPEQYGFGQTDARSDIYALGITLQRMLGREYRGSLQKVIAKCTAFDPAGRYASVDELWQDVGEQRRKYRLRLLWVAFAGMLAVMLVVLWPGNTVPEEQRTEEIEENVPVEEISTVQENAAPVPVAEEQTEAVSDEAPESAPPALSQAISQPMEPAQEEKTFRYPSLVKQQCTFYLNGAPFEGGIAIPEDTWQNWPKDGEKTFFPSDWVITLHIDNQSARDFVSPTMEITSWGTVKSTYTQTLANILSGDVRDIDIPLGGMSTSSRIFMMGVLLEDVEGNSMYWEFQFYLGH